MTYAATFEDVCRVLRDVLDLSAEVVEHEGEPCAVVVHCLLPSMRATDAPVLAAIYRNASPPAGISEARWGVQIEYPDHLTTYEDEDPTLGEGWNLHPAATLDASAELLAAILLGHAAESEARPTTKTHWTQTLESRS